MCDRPPGLSSCDQRVPPERQAGRPVLQRGSALLTVMWLSAALAAIGFSLAGTVRGETERTSTELDGLRSYYLAAGGIERASLELLWVFLNPEQPRLIPKGSTVMNYSFESGMARVEFLPEAGKLDVNKVPVDQLDRLLVALGTDPQRAAEITMNIAAWRQSGSGNGGLAVAIDPLASSFQTPHASFQGIEEMLAVRGVTPEIFYGTYVPVTDFAPPGAPRLQARPGLVDCLSVFGSTEAVDVNTAQPAVLAAIGLPPDAIAIIVERRRIQPFTLADINNVLGAMGIPTGRLRVEGNSIVTIRATARLRLPNGQLSDLKRTVAAMVKYMPPGYDSRIHILRWYDTAFAGDALPDPVPGIPGAGIPGAGVPVAGFPGGSN
jgi:general secretion pathway protein K